MAEIEQKIQVGELRVGIGDVLIRTSTLSGEWGFDTFIKGNLREGFFVYEIAVPPTRVLASAIGTICPQGNIFSFPEKHLTPQFFKKFNL